MSEGLKPCPFCGQEPLVERMRGGGQMIRCFKCGIFFGTFTEESATDAWNRRASQ